MRRLTFFQGIAQRIRNQALRVDNLGLATFGKHLSSSTRFSASSPNYHFTAQEQNLIGNICKYGNLRLDTLNEATDNHTMSHKS